MCASSLLMQSVPCVSAARQSALRRGGSSTGNLGRAQGVHASVSRPLVLGFMPILLWLLGVPLVVVIGLYLFHVI